MNARNYYDVDVVKEGQVKDVFQTKTGIKTIEELENSYESIRGNDVDLGKDDYIRVTEIFDLANGNPKAPLTRSHFFRYDSKLVSNLKE